MMNSRVQRTKVCPRNQFVRVNRRNSLVLLFHHMDAQEWNWTFYLQRMKCKKNHSVFFWNATLIYLMLANSWNMRKRALFKCCISKHFRIQVASSFSGIHKFICILLYILKPFLCCSGVLNGFHTFLWYRNCMSYAYTITQICTHHT